jgi:hypothetical protein
MMTSRQFAIASTVTIGLLMKSLLGCGSDTASHFADAGAVDAGKDKAGVAGAGGLGGTGGQAGTGGGIDTGISSSGGDAAGSPADGSGGAVDGGGPSGSDGACASLRICDPADSMLGYGPGADDPSLCPLGYECYYLQGDCGPTACVLRAGVHCDDPLVCDPGDFPVAAAGKCLETGTCYQKSLCGKYLICSHSVDGGASADAVSADAVLDGGLPVDLTIDGGAPVDDAIDGMAPVDLARDDAQISDTGIDGNTGLIDGAACNPEEEYQRRYVADSPAVCATIRYTCPDNTTGFQNDCGCGCEQRSSCPQYVNCMPGLGDTDPLCDMASVDCPYTIRAE